MNICCELKFQVSFELWKCAIGHGMCIALVHIPDLILKLYVFIPFLIRAVSLRQRNGTRSIFIRVISLTLENGTRSSRSNGKKNKFEYNIWPLEEKKWEDNFIANRKFTSCYNINRIWEKRNAIFIELWMKIDPFVCIKGT